VSTPHVEIGGRAATNPHTSLRRRRRKKHLNMSTTERTTNIGRDKNQPLTTAYLHEIFRNLESGDGKGFFDHVANDVDWIVEGTHLLAGHYRSKADFFTYL
jgi:hypothetical protein